MVLVITNKRNQKEHQHLLFTNVFVPIEIEEISSGIILDLPILINFFAVK